MEVVQLLVVMLSIALFIVGLGNVVGALTNFDSSSKQIAKRSSAEIEQVASEGEQAMDDLSEQYLNKVYDRFTHQ